MAARLPPEPPEEVRKLFEDSIKILREDAQLAHNRALMERLDKLEANTRKTPQTPEEKAAAWDEYMASQQRNSGGGNPGGNPPSPAPPTGGAPTPPNQKPAPDPSATQKTDWWWGNPNE